MLIISDKDIKPLTTLFTDGILIGDEFTKRGDFIIDCDYQITNIRINYSDYDESKRYELIKDSLYYSRAGQYDASYSIEEWNILKGIINKGDDNAAYWITGKEEYDESDFAFTTPPINAKGVDYFH